MRKFLCYLVFTLIATIHLSSQSPFKFDNTSVTFPDGTSQNTAAKNNSFQQTVEPSELSVSRMRAIFSGIDGPVQDPGFGDHVVITDLNFDMARSTNGVQFKSFKFTKPHDKASVDLLARFLNQTQIPISEFKVLMFNDVGMIIVSHVYRVSDALITEVENIYDYDETQGFILKEEYTVNFRRIEIIHHLDGQESITINGNF